MAENSAKKVTIIESLSFLEIQKGIYNGLQNFHYLIKGNTPVKQEIFRSQSLNTTVFLTYVYFRGNEPYKIRVFKSNSSKGKEIFFAWFT